MTDQKELQLAGKKAIEMIKESGIRLTEKEETEINVTDFELGDINREGAQILEWINTERVCVRLIALLPEQTLPEHYHKATEEDPGKEEIIRVVSGTLHIYIPGPDSVKNGFVPENSSEYYKVRHEVTLTCGGQLVLEPGTTHWFQAGNEGSVMYSFSSQSKDLLNIFTNPNTIKGCRINEIG